MKSAPILSKAILILLVFFNTSKAVDRYSITNGSWNTGTTWSNTFNGASCNCTPSKSDNIYIYHNVTLDKNLTGGSQGLTAILTVNSGASLDGGGAYSLEMRTGSTLTINGALVINDLTYDNGSAILIQSLATVTVNGSFTNKMNSNNVTINGTKTVNGAFTNNNNGVINGTGNIYITNGPATNGTSANVMGNNASNPCASFPCVLGAVPLPIELTAFSALRKSYGVEIQWTTATEINNDYFTIERSSHLSAWEEVTTLRGAGNSSHELNYKHVDDNPLNTDCFYRLRQTDYDGKYHVFNPISVDGAGTSSLKLYPNPAPGNKVTINLGADDVNKAIIKVYNMTGSEVNTRLISNGDNSVVNIEIDNNAIRAQKMFYVTVISSSGVMREKLVINR